MSIQDRIITIIVLLLCSILFFNIGFASDIEDDEIYKYNGNEESFNIEFANEKVIDSDGTGRVEINVSSDNKNINISDFELEYPGAYASFCVDIINKGKTEAQIGSICVSGFENSDVIEFEILDKENFCNTILQPKESCTVNFRIKWLEKINVTLDESFNFNIQIPLSQAK